MLKLNLQGDVEFDEVLSSPLNEDIIRKWLLLEPLDPFYPLAIIGRMSWGYRAVIRTIVQDSDQELQDLFNEWSRKCAGFTFPSGSWDIQKLSICHFQSVNSYAIDKFFVTDTGIRLFELHSGDILTDFEFEYVFGETIVEQLTQHKSLVADHMDNAIEQYQSDIVERVITASCGDSVVTKSIKCLEASGPDNWVYQLGGMKVLEIEQTP